MEQELVQKREEVGTMQLDLQNLMEYKDEMEELTD